MDSAPRFELQASSDSESDISSLTEQQSTLDAAPISHLSSDSSPTEHLEMTRMVATQIDAERILFRAAEYVGKALPFTGIWDMNLMTPTILDDLQADASSNEEFDMMHELAQCRSFIILGGTYRDGANYYPCATLIAVERPHQLHRLLEPTQYITERAIACPQPEEMQPLIGVCTLANGSHLIALACHGIVTVFADVNNSWHEPRNDVETACWQLEVSSSQRSTASVITDLAWRSVVVVWTPEHVVPGDRAVLLAVADLQGSIGVWQGMNRERWHYVHSWTPGWSQVLWHPYHVDLFISTHDTRICVWHLERGNQPVWTEEWAHAAQIESIVWYRHGHALWLITAGHDRLVKCWRYSDNDHSLTSVLTIETHFVMRRLQITPFASAVSMVPLNSNSACVFVYPLLVPAVDEPGLTYGAAATVTLPGSLSISAYEWCADGIVDHRDRYRVVAWQSQSTERFLTSWRLSENLVQYCRGYASSLPHMMASETAWLERTFEAVESDEFWREEWSRLLQTCSSPPLYLKIGKSNNIHEVLLNVTFSATLLMVSWSIIIKCPRGYPKVALVFEDSKLSVHLTAKTRRAIIHDLNLRAYESASKERPHLFQLVLHLQRTLQAADLSIFNTLALLDQQEHESDQGSVTSLHPNSRPLSRINSTEALHLDMQKSRIPFPVLSGARFSWHGDLIVFGCLHTHRQAMQQLVKRMADQRQLNQKKRLFLAQNEQKSSMPRALDAYVPFRQLMHKKREIGLWYGASKDGKRSATTSVSSLLEQPQPSQTLQPKSYQDRFSVSLLPVDRRPLISYQFNGTDATSVCEHNAQLALSAGRPEAARAWRIISLLLDNRCSWKNHPLGQPLIHKIFEHFKEKRDWEILAVMVAVLDRFSSNERLLPVPKLDVTYLSIVKPPLITLPVKLSSVEKFSVRWADLLPSVSETKLSPISNGTRDAGILSDEKEIALFTHIYANMLYCHGELNRRTELFRCSTRQRAPLLPKVEDTFQCAAVCSRCGVLTTAGVCDACRGPSLRCSICRLSMKSGLVVFCAQCGHGGHVQHLQEWFSLEKKCPLCDCSCSFI